MSNDTPGPMDPSRPLAAPPSPPGPHQFGPPAWTMPPPAPARRERRGLGVFATVLIAGLTAAIVGAFAGLGGYVIGRSVDQTAAAASPQSAPVTLPQVSGPIASEPGSINSIVSAVMPSVVSIQVDGSDEAGSGSGFVLRPDGYLLTNNHVVDLAASGGEITVVFSDGSKSEGTIVGRNPEYDLAVVKVDRSDLTPLTLGNSDDVLVGDLVVAIGAPLGLDGTVTSGIVSAKDRPVTAGGVQDMAYINAIQTDAAINPGNSGGPLVNAVGEVIGVNSSIYSPSGGSVGLGFAIPIDRTKRIVEDLLEHGAVRQPWVGIRLRTPDAQSAREVAVAGAIVARVVPGSPAERAGVVAGDQIVGAGTRPVRNPFDWEARLLDLRVGEALTITVRRGRGERQLTLRVADAPEVSAPKVTVLRELQLVTLTDAIRQERGIASANGALVYRASERIREEIGLQEGDVIVQVGRQRVGTAEAASGAIDQVGARGPVFVVFERNRQYLQTQFSLR